MTEVNSACCSHSSFMLTRFIHFVKKKSNRIQEVIFWCTFYANNLISNACLKVPICRAMVFNYMFLCLWFWAPNRSRCLSLDGDNANNITSSRIWYAIRRSGKQNDAGVLLIVRLTLVNSPDSVNRIALPREHTHISIQSFLTPRESCHHFYLFQMRCDAMSLLCPGSLILNACKKKTFMPSISAHPKLDT